MEEGEKGIVQLLTDLELQKGKQIEENFQKLEQHFKLVFQRIVPRGRAQIKLVKASENDISQAEEANEPSQVFKCGDKVYSGISVKVSFAGIEENNMSSLEHLSGGQKAVVAVSLLFAIQKIDPAPFYIFDELDSPLDAIYRQALANLIQEFAEESQFLITTFKPDLVPCAEKIFEVSQLNKMSKMKLITPEEANRIVRQAGQDDGQMVA